MNLRRAVILLAAALLIATAPAGRARASESRGEELADYVCKSLHDFTAELHVAHYDERAGTKINRDFGYIYKLKGDVRISYKVEDQLRIDALLGHSHATMIVAGNKQYVRIPALGIKTTLELGDSPGKRKTLLDVGLISPGYLEMAEGRFLGKRRFAGVSCAVFNVQYRRRKFDTSHRLIWIDPRTKVVLKREEYSQAGKLNATYSYEVPTQVARGIWFPSRIRAVNNEGEVAGVTEYRNVHVNTGLPDSDFQP